jgi:hypothetical protein
MKTLLILVLLAGAAVALGGCTTLRIADAYAKCAAFTSSECN